MVWYWSALSELASVVAADDGRTEGGQDQCEGTGHGWSGARVRGRLVRRWAARLPATR